MLYNLYFVYDLSMTCIWFVYDLSMIYQPRLYPPEYPSISKNTSTSAKSALDFLRHAFNSLSSSVGFRGRQAPPNSYRQGFSRLRFLEPVNHACCPRSACRSSLGYYHPPRYILGINTFLTYSPTFHVRGFLTLHRPILPK